MLAAMRKIITLALPLILAAPLLAQQPTKAPGSPDPAAVTGGAYSVDPQHTLVEWELDHLGVSPYFGLFGQVTGSLELDPRNPSAAKVDVTIPVSKVITASSGLTAHLLRAPQQAGGKPDFFGDAPADARFVSTRVAARGRTATITGNLTLNGVTRPVTLAATFYGAGKMPAAMGGKENVGFTATATLRRSDFGLGFGLPMVGDQVKLKIAAAFVR